VKNLFPGFYQPTQEEFTNLWDKCIFTVDANVLLNLYRYTPTTRSEFLKILDRISDRLWICHQVALEYQRNRLNVIAQQKKAYSEVIETFNDANKLIEGKLNEYRRHPYINVPSLIKQVGKFFNEINKELEVEQDKHPDLLTDDDLRKKITDMLTSKVGAPYTAEKMSEIYKQGEKRYQENIPPGYMDAKEKKDNSKYADLVLWFQIMDKAKEKKTPIILVSDDSKEDWWWMFSGKVVGPRPELIEEFITETKMKIYFYPSDRFMEHARDYFKEHVGQRTINEVQNIRKDEEDRNIRESLSKQIQESESSEIERLRLNWRRVLEEVPMELKKTNALALLRAGGITPVAVEGDVVTLSCKYSIHKDNLEKPEYREIAERIISNYFGHPCHVQVVVPLDQPVFKAHKF
jgi:hypothetical protein